MGFVSLKRAPLELQDFPLCLEVGVTGFRLFMLEGFLMQKLQEAYGHQGPPKGMGSKAVV